jgi:hypothetical protein
MVETGWHDREGGNRQTGVDDVEMADGTLVGWTMADRGAVGVGWVRVYVDTVHGRMKRIQLFGAGPTTSQARAGAISPYRVQQRQSPRAVPVGAKRLN